jgi:Zn-dependent peptidase ImmA (M78 family)
MTRVAVSSEVLTWAIERSGRTIEDLEQRFSRLTQWQKGQVQPTLRQLEAFAQGTGTPLGFLLLERPPEERLPIPFLRTDQRKRHGRPSADFLETLYAMQRRQAWMREYLIDEGHEPLPFVDSASLQDKPENIAASIREALGLQLNWASEFSTWSDALRLLRQAIDEAGILVIANGVVGNNTHRKLDVKEFRGFVLVDEHVPLVFVNAADARAAQMFTLAHELAHVWFGSSAAFDLRHMQPADDETERVCNQVGAEFLVPEAALRELWPRVRQDSEPFQAVARHFKVSALVAARRALDLELIGKQRFIDFYQAYLEDDRRKKASAAGGGDFYATQKLRVSPRFGRTVIQAARQGKLLYREAYDLTGLYGRTFETFALRLEGAGGE